MTVLVALAQPAHALTEYGDLASWQAAVGSYQVEDFEGYPETVFPLEGGQIVLDELVLEADAQGAHEWAGAIGLRLASCWEGQPDTMGFLASLEFHGGGATYNHIIFPQPVQALFFELTWTEDGWFDLDFGGDNPSINDPSDWYDEFDENVPYQVGFVFDEPMDRIGIVCDHTWCHVDAVYWQVVPEPATAALLALGLLGLAARRARGTG